MASRPVTSDFSANSASISFRASIGMGSRTILLLMFGGLAGTTCGCGDNGLALVPVSGKVMFAGNAPPRDGTITFTPLSVPEGLPRRPGSAHFDKEGDFQVTSFKENDGLIPGTYYASITCWMGAPSSSDPSSFERLNYVPKDFQAPPVVVKKTDDEVTVVIDVPQKK